jgi:hypothetical protein
MGHDHNCSKESLDGALAAQGRRFGYRRLHILMIREGICMNHKKLRRLYREEGLQVRRRGDASGRWDAGADHTAAGAQSALEPGFPVGCAGRRSPLPHLRRGRARTRRDGRRPWATLPCASPTTAPS